jgi:toxin-antitoxin system PIN domain toxin
LSRQRFLLDVNVLIALSESDHIHHERVMRWFNTPGLDWGLCAFSEAGFLRVSANSTVGKLTVEDSIHILASLTNHPGYRFWPISENWATLVAPFQQMIYGHQQITDAYLLGLAIRGNGILDKAITYLAGPRHSRNVLVLE